MELCQCSINQRNYHRDNSESDFNLTDIQLWYWKLLKGIWKICEQLCKPSNLCENMEYYRSNSIGGMPPTNTTDVTNSIINSASDAYASNYWNIPYTDGLSPMKQIEGAFFFKYKFLLFLKLFAVLWFNKNVSLNHYIIKMWIQFKKLWPTSFFPYCTSAEIPNEIQRKSSIPRQNLEFLFSEIHFFDVILDKGFLKILMHKTNKFSSSLRIFSLQNDYYHKFLQMLCTVKVILIIFVCFVIWSEVINCLNCVKRNF